MLILPKYVFPNVIVESLYDRITMQRVEVLFGILLNIHYDTWMDPTHCLHLSIFLGYIRKLLSQLHDTSTEYVW